MGKWWVLSRFSTSSVPYRTVPYRTVPYRTVPYRTVPYRIETYQKRFWISKFRECWLVSTSVVRQKVDCRRTFHFDTRIHSEVTPRKNVCACVNITKICIANVMSSVLNVVKNSKWKRLRCFAFSMKMQAE
jgi:hypothetical protein